VLLGDGVVVRCEMKNAFAMDGTELGHPGYVGDSVLGFGCHLGCQALTANLPLLGGPQGTVVVELGGGLRVDLGRRKLGLVMGDGGQLGCGSVSEPGCLMGKNTCCYPLTRLPKGVYGPSEVIKNKPWEHGVIERAPFVE
jgi:NDP-sugar pyrophosphorylase family protein